MKKKISLIMVMLLSVIAICSCGSQKTQSATDAAKQTVSGFFDSLKSKGLDEATKYLADEIKDEMDFDLIGGMISASGLDFLSGNDSAESFVNDLMKKVFGKINCNITDAEENEDGSVTVSTKISMPDFDSIGDIFEDTDAMEKIFGTSDPMEMVQDFAKRKGVSVLDLMQDTDEDQLMSDIFELYMPEINKFVDEALSSAPYETEDAEITVEKQSDGSWKIADFG